jgi:hypothetical protein
MKIQRIFIFVGVTHHLTEPINHYAINNRFKRIVLVYLHYKNQTIRVKYHQGESAIIPQPRTDKEYRNYISRADKGG